MYIRTSAQVDVLKRPIVSVSLGCNVEGASQPHVDPIFKPNVVAGLVNRIATDTGKASPEVYERLAKFVYNWCKLNLTPLPSDSDLSIDRWLEHTNYPKYRKEALKHKHENLYDPRSHKRIARVKAFIKDESYPTYKHARGIYSRTDEFKTLVGPIFKLIEEELFKLEWFIKKIPIADRPEYIYNKVYQQGSEVIETDYTSYEAHFIEVLMENCEFVMYRYMTQNLPPQALKDFQMHLKWISGTQIITFKEVYAELLARRQSGEMCTSLGNGFSNLMFFLFTCEEKGIKNPKGVVEGDDGLFSYYGHLTGQDFKDLLSLNVKLEHVERMNEASFCGLIYDEKDLVNITEPLSEVMNFGWGQSKYCSASRKRILELLRCKSLSLAYQYNGCPIISSLAKYGLRMTRGITIRDKYMENHMNMWEREQLMYALAQEDKIGHKIVGDNTRKLMETKFNITIAQQLELEKYLDSLNKLSELKHPLLDALISDVSKHYDANYVCTTDTASKLASYPILPLQDRQDRDMLRFFANDDIDILDSCRTSTYSEYYDYTNRRHIFSSAR